MFRVRSSKFLVYFKSHLLTGVDFAIIQNGYVYHTKNDRPEIIPLGTYQHIGDNLLAYVRILAGSEELGTYDDVSITYLYNGNSN